MYHVLTGLTWYCVFRLYNVFRVENVPPMDWEKYLEEIELDVMEEPHKVSKFHSTQKEEDSTMM